MAMIKCSECGKDISDTAPACIGCGAPMAIASGTSSNGIVDKAKEMFDTAADDLTQTVRSILRSRAEKDNDAVEEIDQETNKKLPAEKTDDQIKCDKFKATLESTIDLKFAEVLQTKQDSDKYLTYVDAQILTAAVRNIFKAALAIAPPQVDAACLLSEAILAPSTQEKQNLLKAAIGLGGGTAGIGMVISGVGMALGWGAGVVTSVIWFFAGHSFAGPVGLISAGVIAAGMAGYFATTSDKQTNTERFIKVLKGSTSKAVDAIWTEHGEALSKAVENARGK